MRISAKESIPDNTTKILDNNKQAYRISLLKILQNFQSRRAISDIIVSLLLVAMTVIVGIIMFGIVKDSGIAESVTSEVSEPLTFEGGIKISAYDARDGTGLSGITGIDNTSNCQLTECKLTSGEHIVLKITNNSPNSIFLNDVIVNEVSHLRDSTLSGNAVEPSEGKFIIIDHTNPDSGSPQIKTTVEINGGTSVRLIIGLDDDLDDISLNDAIRIKIDATGFDLQNFIITAGHAR